MIQCLVCVQLLCLERRFTRDHPSNLDCCMYEGWHINQPYWCTHSCYSLFHTPGSRWRTLWYTCAVPSIRTESVKALASKILHSITAFQDTLLRRLSGVVESMASSAVVKRKRKLNWDWQNWKICGVLSCKKLTLYLCSMLLTECFLAWYEHRLQSSWTHRQWAQCPSVSSWLCASCSESKNITGIHPHKDNVLAWAPKEEVQPVYKTMDIGSGQRWFNFRERWNVHTHLHAETQYWGRTVPVVPFLHWHHWPLKNYYKKY